MVGRPSQHGISTAFFREPVLVCLHEASAGRFHVGISYADIEKRVLTGLSLDLMRFGRQPTTNRPLVRVWIGAALSRLRFEGLVEGKADVHLTRDGLTEANAIMGRIAADPSTKPAIPDTVTQKEQEKPVPLKEDGHGDSTKVAREVERIEKEMEAERIRKEMTAKKLASGQAVKIMGSIVDVNLSVPEDACLPIPEAYLFPKSGPIATQLKEAVIALKNRRSTYIWGLPGSGKDAFIHAFSAMTRSPAQIFTVSPNEDIQSWFFIRSFEKDGTSWEEGEFLKAARDGYTAPDGSKHPYMILVSDLDRATKNQAESLRLLMDSIQGRIMGPKGVKYSIFPGTQIVATANSNGSGDTRGRCVSSNVLDASILDRFERKFKFDTLRWEDEVHILMQKYPKLNERAPQVWNSMGDAVTALRASVDKGTIYAEFGHRSTCAWAGHIQDVIGELQNDTVFGTESIGTLLRRGATVIFDAMPDEETKLQVQRIMDPYIKGGVVGR